MKIDPCDRRQKCRPLTLVSGDIKVYADIHRDSLERGVKHSGVIENVDFQGF